MIVMLKKKVSKATRHDKAASLVKAHRGRNLARTYLQRVESRREESLYVLDHFPAIPPTLVRHGHGEVLDFADASALVRYHAHGYRLSPLQQDKQPPTIQVAVYHAFLLITQQQKRQKMFLVGRHFADASVSFPFTIYHNPFITVR